MNAPNPPSPSLGRLVLHASLASLALAITTIVLTLPGDIGPEQFLAYGMGALAELDSVAAAWRRLLVFSAWGGFNVDLQAVNVVRLVVDTGFFIPLYGAMFLEIARRNPKTTGRILAALVVVLMAVDLVENTSGLAKLAVISSHIRALALLGAILAPLVGIWVWTRRTPGNEILNSSVHWPNVRAWRRLMWIAVVVAAVSVIVAMFPSRTGSGPPSLSTAASFVVSISVASHVAKQALVGVILLLLVVMLIDWVFRPGGTHADRSAMRRGLLDILIRTRYVILVLAVLIVFTLVLNQSRDVIVGLADGLLIPSQVLWAWPALVLTVLGVWALSFSCWLWARLVCRMLGPSPTLRPTLSPTVDAGLQTASRVTARVLGLVPPFVVAVLSGQAARDAVWAASHNPGQPVVSPLWLLAFGAASVYGGLLFLRDRERVSHKAGVPQEDYYDDPKLVGNWMATIAAEKYHFMGLRSLGPARLAIVAFILAIAIRCLIAIWQPGISLAVTVIVLSLVAWIGVLGWLSLKERREARPWALAVIAVVGVLGYGGLTENHVVRIAREGVSGALPSTGAQVVGVLLLAVCIVVTAAWLVQRAIRTEGHVRWSWWLILAVLAPLAVLIGVDRWSRAEANSSPQARLGLDEAFGQWTLALWNNKSIPHPVGEPVYFVTSEGGGMRAAYWTARALEALRNQNTAFNERTFMLSGVSGGAVGMAAYVACSEHGVPADQVTTCLTKFGTVDVLTPMIGAWLFEDAVARVVPTSLPGKIDARLPICSQPGCGFLSRGLWFEQGLEHAAPGLKQGIVETSKAEVGHLPQLFLNSTWVESGDRAVGSGVLVDWEGHFPVARDPLWYAAMGEAHIAEGTPPRVDMPLSAAAHDAGRFPFVNALGIVREPHRKDSGHLADGGYFDNSGAHTAIDVLASFRVWINGSECNALDGAEFCTWVRGLRPKVFVIQNGISIDCHKEPTPDAQRSCLRRQWGLDEPLPCNAEYDPRVPATKSRLKLFADLAGPLVTVINVSGLGGNGRLAAAMLQQACEQFAPGQDHCAVQIAQREDGALYPLGWYLSPTARAALDRKAVKEVRDQLDPKCSK